VNVQEYIESGSIESCVLRLATTAEQQEFERLCIEYPEVLAAREAFETNLESAAISHAVPPPASLRNKILSGIEQVNHAAQTAPLRSVRQADESTNQSTGWKKFMAAATVILLAGSLALNVYLYKRYSAYNELYTNLLASQQELADNNQTLQSRLQTLEQDMILIRDPEMLQVKLDDVNKTNSKSTVYWNASTKDIFLMVNHLPAPEAGKQYQLWAIVDGKPVDAGMISLENSKGLLRMKNIPKAEAFAITLEKAGGSQTPTLTAMFAMGKV
jgi:anti-sigma-K factor RskA